MTTANPRMGRKPYTEFMTLPVASGLVMSTTNRAFDPFPENFVGKITHRIGDCAAPRLAAYAFHEGRKLALEL